MLSYKFILLILRFFLKTIKRKQFAKNNIFNLSFYK